MHRTRATPDSYLVVHLDRPGDPRGPLAGHPQDEAAAEERPVTLLDPLPHHGLRLDPEVEHATGEVAGDGAKRQGGSTRPGEGPEATQVGVGDPPRHLGVDGGEPLDQRGGDPRPRGAIGAADHHETLRIDADLPGGHRAQPAANVDHGDHPGSRRGGEQRQGESGEARPGEPDQTRHPTGFEGDRDGRDGLGRRSAQGTREE
jgi:hypothetical protein